MRHFPPFQLRFEEDLKITKMYSGEGECVDFRESLYPTGNVEDWMGEIERIMKESLRLIIKDSLEDYKKVWLCVCVCVCVCVLCECVCLM